ncbi:MAG: PEP-CTERM sorting domain-containing protein [Armatimonadetes bacterium]|nr:PEP-CTERM sorting domain-containing protein [Armatimonadota bacterium]
MKKLLIINTFIGIVGIANASITFNSVGNGQSVGITYNSVTSTTFAGKLNFTNNATSSTFSSVCCDIDHHISGGQTYACSQLSSAAFGGGIQLAGNIVAAVFGSAATNEQCAGLQLAVWEATYDGTSNGGVADFSNGIFGASITGSLLAQATTYYSSVSVAGDAIYFRPSPLDGGQAQLTVVPEPASFAALGFGLLGLRARRKK